MITEKHIEELILSALSGDELFIVEISVDSNNRIHVVLDSDSSVSIEDCIMVSRAVEHQLDREVEDFSLEVTSAGLGQPLKMLRQYNKFIGKGLEITVDSGVKLSGELTKVNGEFVELLEQKKKVHKHKTKEGDQLIHKLALDTIKQARAIVTI